MAAKRLTTLHCENPVQQGLPASRGTGDGRSHAEEAAPVACGSKDRRDTTRKTWRCLE
jgi:hypothetical protein